MAKDDDYARLVADSIIESLESGTAPWMKPWAAADLTSQLPYNPTTSKHYNGINMVNLLTKNMNRQFNDPRWLTYKQADAIGAQVRKGEKGTQIQHWQFKDLVDKLDENGRKVFGEDGKPVKIEVERERPLSVYHTVFNASQIDNMPKLDLSEITSKRLFSPIDAAENILRNSGADIVMQHNGKSAHYNPGTDRINLPEREQFKSESLFYATALHELGHWTGHESRLNRDLSNPFGSEGYAKEELRAEIASFMMCSELGLDFDPGHHVAYVGSWIKNLQEQPKEIFRAASDSTKILNFVMELNHEKELEKGQSLDQIMEELNIVPSPEQTLNEMMDELGINAVMPKTSSERLLNELNITPKEHFKDFEALKEYTKELQAQYPHFVVMHGVSLTNGSLYSNYMMADQDNSDIKYLHVTNDGRQEWSSIDKETAITRLENGYKAYLIEGWGLNQTNEVSMKENIATEKTLLFVPYSEKDEAKKAGAKWDKEQKSWYAEEGADLNKFSKWELPHEPKLATVSKEDPSIELSRVLKDHGLILEGDPIFDGKLHRVKVEGDKGKERSGAYTAHSDGRPAAYIQNFKTQTKENWKASGFNQEYSKAPTLSLEELAERSKAFEAQKLEREKAVTERHEEVSIKVRTDWNEARDATDSHPYLLEKGVKANGLKLDNRGNLLMPLMDVNGKVWSAQHIGINGYKGLEPGGKKEGNFFVIGQDPGMAKELIICEGYATGASINEATNKTVVVAVDAGNLQNVAEALRERYPDKAIFMAADNDMKKELEGRDNVGRLTAERAAEAVKGVVLLPRLTTEEVKAGKSDFNDIHKSRGIEELKKQLEIKMDQFLVRGDHFKPFKDMDRSDDKRTNLDMAR